MTNELRRKRCVRQGSVIAVPFCSPIAPRPRQLARPKHAGCGSGDLGSAVAELASHAGKLAPGGAHRDGQTLWLRPSDARLRLQVGLTQVPRVGCDESGWSSMNVPSETVPDANPGSDRERRASSSATFAITAAAATEQVSERVPEQISEPIPEQASNRSSE